MCSVALKIRHASVTFLSMPNLDFLIWFYLSFQDIGSNYYQPMIKYINDKEIFGPYMEKKAIEMPERAEIGSNKYSNM